MKMAESVAPSSSSEFTSFTSFKKNVQIMNLCNSFENIDCFNEEIKRIISIENGMSKSISIGKASHFQEITILK